jgi:hypothetical protein
MTYTSIYADGVLMKRVGVVSLVGALFAGALLASAGAAGAMLSPIPVRTSTADEYAPVAEGQWFAWTQADHAHPNRANVYVRMGSGTRVKVNPRGTSGATGGIEGGTLVYKQYKPGFTGDIRKFNLLTHRRSNFPAKVSTKWDEYHPTISGNWLLFTRYVGSTRTTKVLLYNTHNRVLRTVGSESGRHRYVYSGQVNGDFVAWGRVLSGGQDVFLYQISTRTNTKIPRVDFAQYNPGVAFDGTIYYTKSGNGCGAAASLVRRPVDGPATVLYDYVAKFDVGFGYVDERADGSLHWFYGRFNCLNSRWDIYKVVDSYTLTVTKQGVGTGTVTSDPVGIDCGATCSATFPGGMTVTLTEVPDSGSTFGGWSDSSCGTNPTCEVTIEADTFISANFN